MEIPFVGRDKEIAELKNGLRSAKNGKGKMYLVTGPVGIGKTRLIAEISKYAEQEGFAVLFGRCLDEKAVPYLPIADALEQYSKQEEALPIGLIGGSLEFAEEKGAVAREKTRLLENYLRRLGRISQSQPVLFVLDDLQWADSGTLGFLHYLSRAISGMAVIAIAAYAEEYLRLAENPAFKETINNINIERNCTFLRLSPLGINETSIILGSILGTWKLPKEFISAVYERTGGNPLFVEEMAKAILEQGLFDATKRELKVSIDDIGLPATVKSIISQRLSRFDEEAKKVLRAAAILGRVFEYTALKNTLDMDEEKLLDILDNLIATGYIEQAYSKEEIYKFVHNAVYEVIYSETSTPRRRLMHKRAGIELEKLHGNDKKYYAEIGRHYLLGGEAEKGIAYKILAGEYALANYAIEEALKNLLEAAGALENVKEAKQGREFRLKIHKMLGDCYTLRSEFDKAITEYTKALENAEDKKAKFEILIKLVYPYLQKGEFSKCMEILEEARAIAENDLKLLAEVERNMGWVYEKKGEYSHAVEHYHKAVELSEKSGDERILGEAYHRLGAGYWCIGEIRKAKEYTEKGLEIRKKYNLKKGIAGSYNNLAIFYGDMGEIEKSIQFYEMAKRIYEEIGDLSGLSTIYNNIASVYSLRGEDEQALEFYKKDIEIARRIGERSAEMLALSNIGSVYQDREDYKSALQYYEMAFQISKQLGEKRMLASTLSGMAVSYAHLGEIDKALEIIEEARKAAQESSSKDLLAGVHSSLGEIYRLSKRFEESEEEYKRAIEIYQQMEKMDSYWSTKFELARLYIDLGRYAEALNLLNDAKEFFKKIGGISMLKKIEKELARIERSKG